MGDWLRKTLHSSVGLTRDYFKSEFPINLWPNAVQAYHRWIRTCIKENLPYDRFAREMLVASGSNFRKPQVNFLGVCP